MQNKIAEADIGVIVGRFQTHKLTPGQRALIEEVCNRHKKVIVFLGDKVGVKLSHKNPLDFFSRKAMIQQCFPQVTVLPIKDSPSDTVWSIRLDSRIEELAEGASVLLYGSRDSFIATYVGKYPTVELQSSVNISATEVRKFVAHEVCVSDDFRRGVIYAAFNKHPVSFQTVDMACIRPAGAGESGTHVVALGKKTTDPDGKWRFPGGFVSPTDLSLEAAASRELFEELGGIGVSPKPIYLGSTRVADWRYVGESDQILTAFFVFHYMHGRLSAGDDLVEAAWRPIDDKLIDILVPNHQTLGQMLLDYLNRS